MCCLLYTCAVCTTHAHTHAQTTYGHPPHTHTYIYTHTTLYAQTTYLDTHMHTPTPPPPPPPTHTVMFLVDAIPGILNQRVEGLLMIERNTLHWRRKRGGGQGGHVPPPLLRGGGGKDMFVPPPLSDPEFRPRPRAYDICDITLAWLASWCWAVRCAPPPHFVTFLRRCIIWK